MSNQRINIVVLNWRGWQDTIACLESIYKSSYKDFSVTVVDNDSGDESIAEIARWAAGQLDVAVPEDPRFKAMLFPAVAKPLTCEIVDWHEDRGFESRFEPRKLTIIKSPANYGFGGGNNIGLKYALGQSAEAGGPQYFWVLNNDTLIDRGAIGALAAIAHEYQVSGQRVGIIGSKIRYYDHPSRLQGIGGKINTRSATTTHVGSFETDEGQYDRAGAVSQIDYPIGASMFVSRAFLQDVGLICEDHFLYFEEIEWVFRAKRKNWKLGFCWNSIVYHKEGVSTGAGDGVAERSRLADYCYLRARIRLANKIGGVLRFSVIPATILSVAKRLRVGRYDLARNALNAVIDAYSHHRLRLPR